MLIIDMQSPPKDVHIRVIVISKLECKKCHHRWHWNLSSNFFSHNTNINDKRLKLGIGKATSGCNKGEKKTFEQSAVAIKQKMVNANLTLFEDYYKVSCRIKTGHQYVIHTILAFFSQSNALLNCKLQDTLLYTH